jgi:hypothetical protein
MFKTAPDARWGALGGISSEDESLQTPCRLGATGYPRGDRRGALSLVTEHGGAQGRTSAD